WKYQDHLCSCLPLSTAAVERGFSNLKRWKIVARYNGPKTKCVIQPIIRQDGTIAVTDKEITEAFMVKYGNEIMSVQSHSIWYNYVENTVERILTTQRAIITETNYSKTCEIKNIDLNLYEIENAIK
ncbi:unnamed protein product, partial [Owenia fusiformis]